MTARSDQPLWQTGYYDEAYDEYVPSETQGPGVINPADNAETNARYYDAMDEELLSFVKRDEDPALVEHRWNRPEDDLEVLDAIVEFGLEQFNIEILTAFRRMQLHRVCQAYFGTSDYLDSEIVLKWKPDPNRPGRYTPELSMRVTDWIEMRVEEKGTQLAGYMSCLQTLRYKLVRRDKRTRFAPNRRVLTTSEVGHVIAQAINDYAASL